MSIKNFQNNDALEAKIGEVQAAPTANTLLDRLKTLYTTLTDGNQKTQVTGNNAFQTGNPSITDKDCTLAATNYDIDINTALSRNGHFGFVRSKSTNSGTVQVAISYDGASFSSFMSELLPGESMSLDGMDIDTVRVKSSVAGDDAIVGVW